MNVDPQLAAVPHEGERLLHGGALLDILENGRVTRFESHDDSRQPASFMALSISKSACTRQVRTR